MPNVAASRSAVRACAVEASSSVTCARAPCNECCLNIIVGGAVSGGAACDPCSDPIRGTYAVRASRASGRKPKQHEPR